MPATRFPNQPTSPVDAGTGAQPGALEQPRVHPKRTVLVAAVFVMMVLLMLLAFLLSTIPHAGTGV